jgi:hypothetical protein
VGILFIASPQPEDDSDQRRAAEAAQLPPPPTVRVKASLKVPMGRPSLESPITLTWYVAGGMDGSMTTVKLVPSTGNPPPAPPKPFTGSGPGPFGLRNCRFGVNSNPYRATPGSPVQANVTAVPTGK